MRALYQRYVDFWDQREAADSLAWVRMLLSATLVWDLLWIGWYGLPTWFWADRPHGGTVMPHLYSNPPLLVQIFTPDATFAWTLWALCIAAFACFGAGLFTRFSGAAALLLYAQTAWINTDTDRGIDRMTRIVLVWLLLSGSGKSFSLDALRKTGSFRGGGLIPAWPRYMIVGQLVIMYFYAGIEKWVPMWYPWGGYSALYTVLQGPLVNKYDFSVLAHPVLYPLTQIGTAVSHTWEVTYPVILLGMWATYSGSQGRLATWLRTLKVREVYILIGIAFHLLLLLTMELGIFPVAMLAIYPAFIHPRDLWPRLRAEQAAELSSSLEQQ